MFTESADLYDAFYSALGKDYDDEAATVLRLVRPHVRRPRSLLDVACGTGRHLAAFAATVPRCAGLDLDPGLLAVARERLPTVEFVHGDMVDFDLGERFDVVTCLFSAIGYLTTVAKLRAAVRTMARHLTPRGVLVVEPWFRPEQWDAGYLGALLVDEPGLKAARLSRSRVRRDVAILDFDYLVADARSTRHFTETHELRLWRDDDYADAFSRAGLDVRIDDYGVFGRGLFLGTRPR